MKNIFNNIFLFYIRVLAKIQLFKLRKLNSNFKIVGISGSAGKTSTMLALYAMLKDRFNTKYSKKANSETGIPLNILGFTPHEFSLKEWVVMALLSPLKLITNWHKYDVYIVELGVDSFYEPKNMKYLLKIIVPDIAIYTNVFATHSENYQLKDLTAEQIVDKIAEDKNLLIAAVKKKGSVILNMDDARVAKSKSLAKAKVVEVRMSSATQINLQKYLLPKHYQMTFNLALKAAAELGMKETDAINSLIQNFTLPPGRSSYFQGKYNSKIIDSSYNSNRDSLNDLIDLLNETANKDLRIAVLGDMRELGSLTESEHRLAADYSIGKVDKYYLVGPAMLTNFADELIKKGVAKEDIKTFTNTYNCLSMLKQDLEMSKQEKLILVKGSQNELLLEIIVEALLKNEADKKMLCRRGELWDKKRLELKQNI